MSAMTYGSCPFRSQKCAGSGGFDVILNSLTSRWLYGLVQVFVVVVGTHPQVTLHGFITSSDYLAEYAS